jgi:cysteine desulfurase / selenocysteine lyase
VFDLATAQADTPAGLDRVFLDSAGSSLPPRQVLDAVFAHLRREAEIGGYRAGAERADDIERGYHLFAELLDCRPDDLAFTDGATRGWLSLLNAVPLDKGDRVLISEVEYGGNAIGLFRLAERTGVELCRMPSEATGRIDVDALGDLLDERVKLVSLVHVPTNGGLVNPVGALVLLDACQSTGQLPVRVAELGADLVSGTGRKWLRGPRGTGFLVATAAARERLRPGLVDNNGGTWTSPDTYTLRPDARVFELYEHSVAGRLGLFAAAEYALAIGLDAIAAEVSARAGHLRAGLATIPGVTLRDRGVAQCGLVTFTLAGMDVEQVRDALWDNGITVSANYARNTRIDMDGRGLPAVVRASPHYFVSDEQLDQFLTAVAALAHPR